MRIEIFRTGRHTDSAGRTQDWTEADLDRIVRSYDPGQHEAPVVIGHPVHNAPAFGWAKSLQRVGDRLFAELHQVQPEFMDMLQKGLFKKRSISVYPDGRLRHIGFLGAQPPAVQGLTDVQFHADPVVQVEFSSDFQDLLDTKADQQQAQHAQGALDFYLLPHQQGSGPAPFSSPPAFSGQAAAQHAPPPLGLWGALPPTSGNSGGIAAGQPGGLPQLSPSADMRVQQLESEIAAMRRQAQRRDWQQFSESLQHSGRLLPAQEPVALALMSALAQLQQPLEFQDAQGLPQQKEPLSLFQEFLAAMPVQVEFGELATSLRASPQGAQSPDDIARKVSDFKESEAKAGRQISYADALERVLHGQQGYGGAK